MVSGVFFAPPTTGGVGSSSRNTMDFRTALRGTDRRPGIRNLDDYHRRQRSGPVSKVLATPEKTNMAIAGRSHIFSIEICFFGGFKEEIHHQTSNVSNFPVFQGVSLCNSVLQGILIM